MSSVERNDFQIGENTDPTKNLFIQVLEDGQAVISRGSRGGAMVELARFDLNGNLSANVNEQILHVQDQKPSGTAGGSAASGSTNRDLNTVLVNTIPGASLASNRITLPAGAYFIDAHVPTYSVDRCRASLSDITNGVILLRGQSTHASAAGTTYTTCPLKGRFVLAATTTLSIVHYCQTARAGNGLGVETSLGGVNEVYTDVLIKKIA